MLLFLILFVVRSNQMELSLDTTNDALAEAEAAAAKLVSF